MIYTIECFCISDMNDPITFLMTCETTPQTYMNVMCIHSKRKARCRECGGSAFCVHGKERCRECRRSFCDHGKRKAMCRDCGGSFCVHGKRKAMCRDCGGSAFCVHGKRKARCRECKRCSCGRRASIDLFCKTCYTFEKDFQEILILLQ